MVEKVSVNIKILALTVEHNFLIPWDMSVAEATDLIVQAISEEYPGIKHSAPTGYRLMQGSSGMILPGACSFRQLGIVQGETLLLI